MRAADGAGRAFILPAVPGVVVVALLLFVVVVFGRPPRILFFHDPDRIACSCPPFMPFQLA